VPSTAQLLQFTFSGLTTGSLYALVGLSLVIVYRASKVLCFAQGEFVVLGALATISFVGAGLPIWLAVILAILVVAGLGAALERTLIRPLLNSSVATIITMTIGVSLALRGMALLIWGRQAAVLPPFSDNVIRVMGAAMPAQVLWLLGITALCLLALWYFFERTMLGLAMRACAEDPHGAGVVGINLQSISMLSWAGGAALGALAGACIAPLLFVTYTSGIMPMIKAFVVISIGGLTSIVGAVVAGLFLGLLEAFVIGTLTSKFADALVFALLILVLLLKPGGFFGNDSKGGM
jgi:branched-chain amino acid transport system permease protein